MKLEIVSHCWKYYRMLTYQAGSLCLHPPQHDEVLFSVYCSLADDPKTKQRLEAIAEWSWPTNVTMNVVDIRKERLFRRAIGRDMAARSTDADLVWFADVDMFVGESCLDSLESAVGSAPSTGVLFFPDVVGVTTKENGDRLVQLCKDASKPIVPPTYDCMTWKYPKAIGGVQFTNGDALRKHGYVKHGSRYLKEQKRFVSCRGDIAHRRHITEKAAGTQERVSIPDLYRIRHSERGRIKEGLEL